MGRIWLWERIYPYRTLRFVFGAFCMMMISIEYSPSGRVNVFCVGGGLCLYMGSLCVTSRLEAGRDVGRWIACGGSEVCC